METLFQKAFHLAHKLNGTGTCLEFGVGWGDSFIYQLNEIKKNYTESKLIGFDSFKGLPEEHHDVWRPTRHSKGNFSFSKDFIIKKMGCKLDERISLVEGFYEETLIDELRKSIDNVIFVNIDVDLYISSVQVLKFINPLLKTNTILYWDDWKDPKDNHHESWGEHRAYNEWIKVSDKKCETIMVNEYNQRVMRVE